MKKYLNIIAIAVIAILSYSCEETINGVELPYKELLVIRGELKADTAFAINISKTLPPLAQYSNFEAHIFDVKAYIECDNIIYPLEYDGLGDYINSDLIPRAGKTYKLTAEWKNHIAYATTTIPINNDTVYDVYTTVETLSSKEGWTRQVYKMMGTAYLSGNSVTIINGRSFPYHFPQSEFIIAKKDNYKGPIEIGQFNVYNGELFKPVSVIISKYDSAYLEYYQTKDEGEMDSDVFVVSGNNITWNVKGDGIGLFIGSNAKEIFLK